MKYDLLICNGRAVDPSQGLNDPRDIGLRAGKIVELGKNLDERDARETVNARGLLVTPGLIDCHVHVYSGVSHYGIDPDPNCLERGVTTAVDAGSAGAATWDGFRRYVIEVSATRLFALLNISSVGMVTGVETDPSVGELEDLRHCSVSAALETVEANRDVILGIKIRLSANLAANGRNELPALKLAREAAEAARLPLMIHTPGSSLPLPRILAEMRRGDLLTHCFHGHAAGILDERGRVLSAVRQAVRRGVRLDVGHGKGSFRFPVAEQAMRQDILPGTISSDLHRYNLQGPVYDLATTVSKFLLLGVSLDEALRMVTAAPAEVVGMQGRLGTLKTGAEADLALFELAEGRFDFSDVAGETRTGRWKLVPRGVIRAGRVVKRPEKTA